MKFYRYWIKCTRDILLPETNGKTFPMSVYGHSNISLADAKDSGQRLLDGFAKRLVFHLSPWEYDMDGRPIREETLLEQKLRPDERFVAATIWQIFVLQAMPMNVDQHVVSFLLCIVNGSD